ncbi:restriction endonuclease [Parabacteroides sp. OttesenSCG-928-G07]|nr:restriction endonuclease [Parabacteroides sp. OttesenSCG-928-G07]
MNSLEKGKLFEDYIEHVYRLLLDLESHADDEPIIISRNVRLKKNNYSSEFDIYYEFTKARIRHKVGIECKNHSAPVDISYIRDFYGKIQDLNITGVFISNSGFQSGAKAYAEEKGIILLTTDEIPNFFNLIGERIKQIYLPSKFAKGEPFYILMEHKDGALTGAYHVVETQPNKKSIFLFLSKKLALDYLNSTHETDLLIRGLKQEAFDFFIHTAKILDVNFAIVVLKSDENNHFIVEIEPEKLKADYFDINSSSLF